MVSTRKKTQLKRRLHSQLYDFDQVITIGNTASDKKEKTAVIESTCDWEFTVGNPDSSLASNENVVNVKALERCSNEWIDREMSNIVATFTDGIQNEILTRIDSIVVPKIEQAIRSINASSGRDATSVMVSSERGEHIGIIVSFENVSERKITLHVLDKNDETRNKTLDQVSEMSDPRTLFDRQPHFYHRYASNLL